MTTTLRAPSLEVWIGARSESLRRFRPSNCRLARITPSIAESPPASTRPQSPIAFCGGSPHVRHKTARIHHAARRRCGVAQRRSGHRIAKSKLMLRVRRQLVRKLGPFLFDHGAYLVASSEALSDGGLVTGPVGCGGFLGGAQGTVLPHCALAWGDCI
jgi:hypothetical protein